MKPNQYDKIVTYTYSVPAEYNVGSHGYKPYVKMEMPVEILSYTSNSARVRFMQQHHDGRPIGAETTVRLNSLRRIYG